MESLAVMKPITPSNETQRIQILNDLNILDTPIQESFERITRLAKSIFQVPIVAFSLVDSERQWFKSIQGLNVSETTREISFCGHTINQDDILIVNDAANDQRFFDNPLVINDPKIRFYAGCPVRTLDKFKIGTLCLIDVKPRILTNEQIESLKDMARLIEAEVSANKIYFEKLKLIEELNQIKKSALVDSLTRLLNRRGIENILKEKIKNSSDKKNHFGIALVDIDNFKNINDFYGHCTGDEVLRELAKRLLIGYRDTDTIGRWGGEEFLIILDSNSVNELFHAANRARKLIASSPVIYQENRIDVTVTTGISWFDWKNPIGLIELISSADNRLYQGKRRGKNIVIAEMNENESFCASEGEASSDT